MIPSLDELGRALLPRLDAILCEAIEYLTALELYVGAWRDVLEC